MNIDALERQIGNVVVLDLVMGREITTRIKSVDKHTNTVVCLKPRVFVPVPDHESPDPNAMKVAVLRYGHPMYHADEELEVAVDHVFTMFHPTAPHVESYARETSGIVPATATALDDIDRADRQTPGGLIGL